MPESAICWSGWSQPRAGLLMKPPERFQSDEVEASGADVEADWQLFRARLEAQVVVLEALVVKLVARVVLNDKLHEFWSFTALESVSLELTDEDFCRGIIDVDVPELKPG